MSERLLLDNSAWTRLAHRGLPRERTESMADRFEAGEIFVCLPFLLEAGFSARSAADHGELLAELLALPYVPIDEGTERRALEAQSQLARAGHHRLPPVDLLLATLAECHRVAVLHYDADFDVIRQRTDLDFESVWLAPRGSLT